MKITYFVIILFFVFSTASFAQSNKTPALGPVYGLTSEKEAREVIQKIVDVVGLKPNFEIKAGSVTNASAVVYSGKRYILYNPIFLKQVRAAVETDWGGISIIAHEIGHHLNGHTLMGTGSVPSIELEADEFAGFVLRKMGATLEEAQVAMRLISDERDSHTHPARSKRLASIESGWINANNQIASVNGNTTKSKPKTQPQKTPKEESKAVAYSFPRQYIYKKLHLYSYPEGKFILTVKSNLVRVNEKGYDVIGKLIKYKNSFYLILGNDEYLKVTSNGLLVNQANKKVGYLS